VWNDAGRSARRMGATLAWLTVLVLARPDAAMAQAPVEVFPGGKDLRAGATADGSVHVVWSKDKQLFARTRSPEGTWATSPLMPAPFDYLETWGTAINARGGLCVWWFGMETDGSNRTPNTQNTNCWGPRGWTGRAVVGTGSLAAPTIAGTLAPDGSYQSLIAEGSGRISYGDAGDNVMLQERNGNSPAVAIDHKGQAHATWGLASEQQTRVYRRSADGTTWTDKESLAVKRGIAENVLAADGGGRVFALSNSSDLSRWTSDEGWKDIATPEGVGNKSVLTVDPGGHAILGSSYSGETVFAVEGSDGNFTKPQRLAVPTEAKPSATGPFAFAVDKDGLAHVAWYGSDGNITVSSGTALEGAGSGAGRATTGGSGETAAAVGATTPAGSSSILRLVIAAVATLLVFGLGVLVGRLTKRSHEDDKETATSTVFGAP